jgi:c-di-GMP-binding flagellar brake protein YcgR
MQQDSKLTVGQRVELAFGGAWVASRLEDFNDHGDRLVIAWPTDRERRLIPLKAGETVTIAMSRQDALYTAPMRVERSDSDGVPMLRLSVVGEWQRSQRRNAVRVPVAIRPRVAERLDGPKRQPLRAGITDISANGVQLRTQDEIKLGDTIELAFSVLGIEEEFEVQAGVRRVHHVDRGGVHIWVAGCEFKGLSARMSQKLVQFIFAQQRTVARARRTA